MTGNNRWWGGAVVAVAALATLARAQEPGAAARRPPRGPASMPVRRELDLVYAEVGGKKLRLDLYLPEPGPRPLPVPVVVWIHGGAWSAGNKERCPATFLAGRGIAVASINYRLSSEATFPAQIEDCKAAVRWLRANAKKYCLDPDHIGVWGASAGGHLAALMGTAPDNRAWDGVGGNHGVPCRVQAACDFYGPTDFLQMDSAGSDIKHDAPDSPESRLIGGPIRDHEEECRKASPLTYVSRNDAPFLIVHGEDDRVVPIQQSELLVEAIRKAGGDVTFVRVKKAGHGFGPDSQPSASALNEMVYQFFDRHLRPGDGEAD